MSQYDSPLWPEPRTIYRAEYPTMADDGTQLAMVAVEWPGRVVIEPEAEAVARYLDVVRNLVVLGEFSTTEAIDHLRGIIRGRNVAMAVARGLIGLR